jgi:hypothetical protein
VKMRAALWIGAAASIAAIASAVAWLALGQDSAPVPIQASIAGPEARTERAARISAPPSEPEPDLRSPEVAPEQPGGERATAAAGTEVIAGRLFLADGPPGEAVDLRLGAGEDESSWEILEERSSAPDGTFRFEDLPAGWSGDVLLPQHYRLAHPSATLWPDRACPARAGQLDLAIEVVRLPALRGRVLSADGTPAAKSTLIVERRSESASSLWTALTQDDGRFVLPLRGDPLLTLAIACRTDGAESLRREWTASSLPPPDLRGDIHVGDLRLAAGATAQVLVLDPQAEPFPGASVVETGASGGRTFTTGEDGTVLVQLVDGVEGLDVRAQGYSLVELPRPTPGEVVVVHLRPAAHLLVDVVDAGGQPWPHGRLRLKAERPPFEGGRMVQADVPGTGAGACNEWGQDREGTYAICRTDAQGHFEWQGLEQGLPFEITLEDALGTPGAFASVPGLAAGERRSVRLQLAREPVLVSGRCVDAAANGVAGVKVQIWTPGSGSADFVSDDAGAFQSPPLLADRVRLRAHAEGYADCRLEDVMLPADLTLVLEHGRRLQVSLRDASGAPAGLGQLQVRDPATGKVWSASRAAASPGAPATGPQTFAGVPRIGVELVHVWHQRTSVVPVPNHVEEFVWDLPSLGRLEVEVGPCAIGELESGYLLLEALDGRGVVQQDLLPPGEASAFRFETWPGRYRLRRVIRAFTADADGWRTPAGSREVGEPVEVEVLVDRIAHAELESVP